MTIKGKAYIVGAYEHPLRKAPDKSVAQLHAEVAKGAIEDAGLAKDDIDEQKSSAQSTMPEGLEKRWTEAEFVDLVSYLTSLKEIASP